MAPLSDVVMADTTLEDESADLDGYFSETPLDPQPKYPRLRETFETAIVITNLPKVPESKVEKLTKVVRKLVSRIGTLVSGEGKSDVQLPFDETTKVTCGFAVVEFSTADEANQAVEVLQNYMFDKNHALQVTPYEQALQLQAHSEEEFTEPEPAPFKAMPNTSHWLEDPGQRDQFVIRQGRETVVYWSDAKLEPTIDYDGEREKKLGVAWCEYYVHWSPHGSLFATMVPSKGAILWGGKNYEKLGRFAHEGVQHVLFSPQENYLITNNMNRDDAAAIKVFHINTGDLLREFPLYPKGFLDENMSRNSEDMPPPPPFQWSHDDQFLARMGKDIISIYETPTMSLLDKRSLTADGVCEFQFSPKANILAYWAPELGNAPAHVDLIELPSRKKLRQKNLFNVSKCSMVWHPDGDFFGVKVTRHTKSKKTLYNNLELFRMNEPGIPVEMLDSKDAIMAFAWEPNHGTRFAMIHAENPSSTKVNVTFYDMQKKVEVTVKNNNSKKKTQKTETVIVNEVNKALTLEGKQCNCIFWSPAGQHIILASLGDSASGTLEFFDVENKTLTVKEHYRANQVSWDPSGRTVATVVSQPISGGHFKFAMDNGYNLWSFQGKQLHQQSFEAFYQLQWRPRQDLLSQDEIRTKVIKNLKKYEREFDKADKKIARQRYLEETKGKRMLRSNYRETLAYLTALRDEQRSERMYLNDGYDSEDETKYTTKDYTVETILSTKEEVV
uniref:Eukaryotic translation initiation factor 3 subunit B n=1 Tax=Eucampia antarctica TaxID=49252 RepID=A0A7S2WJI7_9STRA|mmetsp:Transcript_347/g.324  ORF Transcript_347/g.324 Transcript_347/m.324 type:complete len:728 (+) Transcript_347:48-2231(+)|eukprot:CAMPEP_0197835312 /NCGR_PEP_ID=MMETSP1437-20131217/25371_1 /TAXON_ID=49252 ORGANISM="Eucampia antarctica, Strain CCMP1452" /NCGR_SAMPLE_ID=MMETSP1437 /ASSEMBLY_ACC=CAM_ASM_001096 /LENGTH=727 /DNA_ID=CAMNT_0043440649 /DNA_START=42 /DNA_END=2225 /DNA_ORIENTATION=+